MSENSEKDSSSQATDQKRPKEISRRQFITGTTEGAISVGVFDHPVARFFTAFTSTLLPPNKQEQNKRMLEQAKRKPAAKESANNSQF